MITLRRYCSVIAVLALPLAATAHQLDEYVQATLVDIEPDAVRLEINLTPGVAIADQVLALVDRNHDGTISTNEGAAYAELLQRDLTVQLDGRKLELLATVFNLPAEEELRTGWALGKVEFAARLRSLAPGSHQFKIENRHLPKCSAYLINAAFPKATSVQILKQTRNQTQSCGEIEFYFNDSRNHSMAAALLTPVTMLVVAVFAALLSRRGSTPDVVPYNSAERPDLN